MNKEYLDNLRRLLDRLENTQEDTLDRVCELCADKVAKGGLMYFFGTGHSHMICEEPFYRAGGLACVYPILAEGRDDGSDHLREPLLLRQQPPRGREAPVRGVRLCAG